MASSPAIRALVALVWLVLLGCVLPGAYAQTLPFAPISPTDPKECQDFGARVETYAADYAAQHEKCLADNKADRPNEPPDSQIYSRSACQYLHDMLYDDYSPISVKSKQKEVSACYDRVREYEAEQAREATEKADEEAREKQEEADEAAERQQAREARETKAKKADEETKQKAALDQSRAAKAEADRIAANRSQLDVAANSTQQTPQAVKQSVSGSHRSSGLVDPFKDSTPTEQQELASNATVVDPFASKETLVDPFSNSNRVDPSEKKEEETWDSAKEIFEGFVDKASDNLADIRKAAQNQMSAADFRKFDRTVGDAHSYLEGFSKTIDVVTFTGDVKKIVDNPGEAESYHDIISDGSSKGLSYVLKRISPDFLSKIWEGPAGWAVAITFDSSSTETPKQDFDPVNVLNNPGQYNFKQREAALKSLNESAARHPEIWNQSRYEWLYSVSERLYNSPDNPYIHLTPP